MPVSNPIIKAIKNCWPINPMGYAFIIPIKNPVKEAARPAYKPARTNLDRLRIFAAKELPTAPDKNAISMNSMELS